MCFQVLIDKAGFQRPLSSSDNNTEIHDLDFRRQMVIPAPTPFRVLESLFSWKFREQTLILG